MLEFHSVSCTIKKKEILRDISFSVKSGRIVALLGKNGSGKTTLLRAANLEIPHEGSILLNREPIHSFSPRERARRMAYLPQRLAAPAMSVSSLVSLGRLPHMPPFSRLSVYDRTTVLEALKATDALSLAERPVHALSGGERQRAHLAMAIAQGAPLLLLDEPTTYLDTDARRSFFSLLAGLVRSEGKAALCVLHDINDAIRLADDIALLENGRLVFFGSTAVFIEGNLPTKHFGLVAHKTAGDLPFYY